LYFFLVRWNGPFGNFSHFDGIHADGIMRDDNSEILYLHAFKFTFLWFKKKVVDVK
jgi:hypothetical protein